METILNKESRAAIELMVADGIIAKDTAERYFPELKESEDERIRKWLIEIVEEVRKANPTNVEHNGMCSDALTWLEKQGEQKPTDKVEPKFKVGDVVTNKKSKDTVKIVQILHDSYCYSGWDGAATVHSDFSISEQDDWELVKQNSAWSKEDDYVIERLFSLLDNEQDNYPQLSSDFQEIEEIKNRLKFFKERVQIQPKQGWSEEDEKAINDIMWIIEAYRKNGFNETHIQMADSSEKWLKSLKNRYAWKPSDEQMDALKQAKTGACGKPYFNALASLYVNLKGY